MRAAWLVRSRQMASDFAFWLAITGYNPRDRSLSQRIYLVYAALFFTLWGFAVLSLLSSLISAALMALDANHPNQAAVGIGVVVLLAWALVQLYRASRRSPLVFSEEDASQICLTPIDRRAVTLAWFPESWLASALPFWAGAVTLGFARAEILLQDSISFNDLPTFLLFALQALLIAIPLQLALLAWVWAAGLYRLKPGRNVSFLPWLAPSLAIAYIVAWWAARNGVWQVLSWPVRFPVEAGFGTASWVAGLLFSIAMAIVAWMLAWRLAKPISLSRAAQETAGGRALQAASVLGNADLARQLRVRERLGSEHPPEKLHGGPGSMALVWRQAVQSRRSTRLGDAASWMSIFLVSLAILLIPGWGPRAWGVAAWVILVGQRATSRFRLDLAQWWLFRQAPIPADHALAAEFVFPWLGITLLGWLALAAGATLPGDLRLAAAAVLPAIAAGVCLAAGYDILRQSKVSLLLAEIAPNVTALGAALGLLFCAVAVAIFFFIGTTGVSLATSTVVALLIEGGMDFFLWKIASHALAYLE